MFRLKLFGGASLIGPDGPVTGRGVQRRRLAFLSLLATARGHGLTRDKIIGLLWPDSDSERARHLLSDSIYRINQAVRGDAIVSAGEDLRIDNGLLSCDAGEFSAAMERGDWIEAVRLSEAPFLDGFFLPGAAEFEQWADVERERFVRERSRALEALARHASTEDDGASAVQWWRALAAHDPFSSRVAIELMRALEQVGDRAAAVRHAQGHADLLRDQLGVEPDPEVRALADRLRIPAPNPPPRHEEPDPHSRGHAATRSRRETDREIAGAAPVRKPASATVEPTAGREAETRAHVPPASDAPPWRWRRYALAVVALVAIGVWSARSLLHPPGARLASIAVLPFADLSPGGNAEYFGDGMAEELMSRLGQVEGVRVVGRTSAFVFKGQSMDAREIGARLGVDAVLAGSVRMADSTLRIVAQFVDARTGYEVWSETYERRLRDVFAIQDEISRAIVARLDTRNAAGTSALPATAPIDDPESYNLYLRGRFEWHRRTEESLRRAAGFFRDAAERSPGYARAWAGLGDAQAVLGFYDYLPPSQAFPAAAQAARRALQIDPMLAEAHATLGYVALYYEWDWARAEAEFLRTIELNPTYSTGHQWYANFLTAMGRFREAEREMRLAQELDPLSLIANAAQCWVLYYAGDYGRAIDQCERTLDMEPNFELAHLWRGLALGEQGDTPAEIAELERAVALSGGSAIAIASLGRARAAAGDTAAAREMIRPFETGDASTYVPSYEIAKVYEALGDHAATMKWLRLAFQQRSHSMVFLRVDPQLRRLREHPDYVALMRSTGLID